MQNPPETFPETVPQSGPDFGVYQYRDAEFWTCGFFPGSLYCLLERSIKYPQHFLKDGGNETVTGESRQQLRDGLLQVCRDWAQPLHEMAYRTDTHDIGFIVEPALRRDYELTGNAKSLGSILTAAESLASRYNEKTSAIRSWDTFVNNHHGFSSKENCFLVIIDSMCSRLLSLSGMSAAGPSRINNRHNRSGPAVLRRTPRFVATTHRHCNGTCSHCTANSLARDTFRELHVHSILDLSRCQPLLRIGQGCSAPDSAGLCGRLDMGERSVLGYSGLCANIQLDQGPCVPRDSLRAGRAFHSADGICATVG